MESQQPLASPSLTANDRELIALAASALTKTPLTDENHTVAAACRSRQGKTYLGVNVHHFTGGPCAELVVLGVAAADGVLAGDIETMVAVVRRVREGRAVTKVISPCGRCRQVMLDYNPHLEVLVLDEGRDGVGAEGGGSATGRGEEQVRKVKIWSLLPFAYVWPDGNTGQKEVV